jgi:hypothetical protein
MYELCNEMYTKFPTYLPNLEKKNRTVTYLTVSTVIQEFKNDTYKISKMFGDIRT